MAFAAFVVPWEKVDQAIVAIHSFKLKNPTWRCRVYSDDVLAQAIGSGICRHP